MDANLLYQRIRRSCLLCAEQKFITLMRIRLQFGAGRHWRMYEPAMTFSKDMPSQEFEDMLGNYFEIEKKEKVGPMIQYFLRCKK